MDTNITANGDNVSLGEKQLISIGRALLRNSDIFIIDEFTNSIDEKHESEINHYLKSYFQEKTVITIVHSIKNIMDSDYILIMEKGKIKEYDSPMNLMSRGSDFRKIVRMSNMAIN